VVCPRGDDGGDFVPSLFGDSIAASVASSESCLNRRCTALDDLLKILGDEDFVAVNP